MSKMRIKGALVPPKVEEKPFENIAGGWYPFEVMKNFGEIKTDVDKFFVSKEIWTASWDKYLDDIKILRTMVRHRAGSKKSL